MNNTVFLRTKGLERKEGEGKLKKRESNKKQMRKKGKRKVK